MNAITALIVDAYDALGTIAEATVAEVPRHRARERWVTAAARIRGWAITHPHEYALLYGSPVPGYAAPVDTVGPGTRVSLALVGLCRAMLFEHRTRHASDADPIVPMGEPGSAPTP